MLFTEENIKKYNLIITKNGYFHDTVHKITYHYHYTCVCGYPFLGRKNSKYCCPVCRSNESNYWLGKIGKLHAMFGRGYLRVGELNPNYKGENGYFINNIPRYDTYAPQLEPMEQCVRDPKNPLILNVFCTYSGCKKQFSPTRKEVNNRIYLGLNNDTYRFYCSSECKQACPLFGQSAQSLMERDAENAGRITKLNQQDIRTNQTTNKKHRFKENGGICDWCEIKVTMRSSILHHEVPVSSNFLMADDPDNHWLLCKACNKKAHQLVSCNYYELRLRRVCSK